MAIPLYGSMQKASGLSYPKPSHMWLLVDYTSVMQQATIKVYRSKQNLKRLKIYMLHILALTNITRSLYSFI